MRKLISYVAAVFVLSVATSIAVPNTDQMLEKENAAWQAFKDKKPDDFKKVVDGDMFGVYADGISDLAKELSEMQKWDMKSFTISDYKTTSDEKDVVVATYTVVIEGTVDGKDGSGTYNAGT